MHHKSSPHHHNDHSHNDSDHHHGLAADLTRMLKHQATDRRQMLRWLSVGAAASAAPVFLQACGGGGSDAGTSSSASDSSTSVASSSSTSSSASSSSTTTSTSSSCSTIPSETAGPYPGDGTNSNGSGTVNVLTLSGIVRSDIRSSVGTFSGTATGVPLTITLKLVNSSASCASLAGYAVYLWHCTSDGNYSLYSSSVLNQNFLRGVQVSDSNGEVTFTTIFPGCYSGRWPHIHFEVYRSLSLATSGSNDIKTSQLALPASACNQVYGVVSGYSASVANFAAISLASDNVFSDDSAASQLASVSGSASNGFAATLTVGVPG